MSMPDGIPDNTPRGRVPVAQLLKIYRARFAHLNELVADVASLLEALEAVPENADVEVLGDGTLWFAGQMIFRVRFGNMAW